MEIKFPKESIHVTWCQSSPLVDCLETTQTPFLNARKHTHQGGPGDSHFVHDTARVPPVPLGRAPVAFLPPLSSDKPELETVKMGFTSYSVQSLGQIHQATQLGAGEWKRPGEATGHRDMVWETARTRHSSQRRRTLHATVSSFTGCCMRRWKR